MRQYSKRELAMMRQTSKHERVPERKSTWSKVIQMIEYKYYQEIYFKEL